jgi:hypothetical protein
MEAILPIILAGVVVSVAVAATAIRRRRGRGLPPGLWRVLAFGWAVVLVVGFLLALRPSLSDLLIPIDLVTGAGLVATAIWTRRRQNQRPGTAAATNRAMRFGLLQLAVGVVLLALFLGRG